MFTRERLEKNNYFIYRMSMNLEIPLQAVYEERSIKSMTQDPQLILRVLLIDFFILASSLFFAMISLKRPDCWFLICFGLRPSKKPRM